MAINIPEGHGNRFEADPKKVTLVPNTWTHVVYVENKDGRTVYICSDPKKPE